MNRKNSFVLFMVMIIASVSPGFFLFANNDNSFNESGLTTSEGSSTIPFIVGVRYLPFTIDPQDAWDSSSNDVLNQIVEPLFTYDYTNPAMPIIPLLASAMGNWDASFTEYTVPLRQGVTFHDGSDFNADDVIFTFNRSAFMYNFTGLNTGYIPDVEELYRFPNWTRIIKQVVKNDNYSITFKLTAPYGPFEDLLTYTASSILPDGSSYTNAFVEIIDDFVIGTGPFIYEHYEEDVEVIMHAFDDYWRGKAHINELIYKEIIDDTVRNAALLTGDLHFLKGYKDEFLSTFNSTTGITLDGGGMGSNFQYLGMNNNLINRTWREAISYAIDYDYIIDDIRMGNAVRLKSPIPQNIKHSISTFDVPEFNLTRARELMVSMGFGIGLNPYEDAEWIEAARRAPFATFNYTFNIGSEIRENILFLLQDNLAKIGIRVTAAGMSLIEYIFRLYEIMWYYRDHLELWWIGWYPDYNEPSTIIWPLFTNRTIASNGAQYNGWEAAIKAGDDPTDMWDNVQLLMEAAIIETDSGQRAMMYGRIQQLLIERDFPLAWGFVDKLYYPHHINLTGFQPNAFNRLYFYSCKWEPHEFIPKNLDIDIIEHSFSSEGFDIKFFIYNETSQGINDAFIQMWWNGGEVSSSVTNMGGGFYSVSLEPITVNPGEDPILLSMTISASGYNDKYFEAHFAIDPELLKKEAPAEEIPIITIIITLSLIGGAIAIGIVIYIWRKR